MRITRKIKKEFILYDHDSKKERVIAVTQIEKNDKKYKIRRDKNKDRIR